MNATSTETSSNDTACLGTITVSLSYSQDLEKPPKRQLHKLGIGVPSCDVGPPDGVLNLGLEIVHLALKISRQEPRKKRKTEPDQTETKSLHFVESSALQVPEQVDHSDDEILDFTMIDSEYKEQSSSDDGLDWCLAKADRDSESPVPFEITECSSSQGAFAPAPQKPWLLKRPSSMVEQELKANQLPDTVLYSEAIQLIDSALRLAMTERPKRLPSGVQATSVESLKRLSDIAPALWSPDHLPAVASHALFLPTIIHALSSLSANAKNPNLRAKVDEIARQEGYVNAASSDFDKRMDAKNQNLRGTEKAIGVRLWHMMQSGLFDANAARSLKPLTGQLEGKEPGDQMLEMDLDSSQESHDMEFEYDDEDDLFGDDSSETLSYEENDIDLFSGLSDDDSDELDVFYTAGHLALGKSVRPPSPAFYPLATESEVDGSDRDEVLSLCGSVGTTSLDGSTNPARDGDDQEETFKDAVEYANQADDDKEMLGI